MILQSREAIWSDMFTRGLLSGLEEAYKKKMMELQNKLAIDRMRKQAEIEQELANAELQRRAQWFDRLNSPTYIDNRPILNPDKYGLNASDFGSIAESELGYTPSDNIGLLSSVKPETFGAYLDMTQDWKGPFDKVYGELTPYARSIFVLTGRLPSPPKPQQPKLEKFQVLDLGDRKVPLLIVNDGKQIKSIIPQEFVVGLSPEAREKLRLAKKKYGLEVKKFNWRRLKETKELDLDKWYKTENLKIQKERNEIQKQKAQRQINELDKKIKAVDGEINKLMKKYRLDSMMLLGSDDPKAVQNIVNLIAQTGGPEAIEDAKRLEWLYEQRKRLTNKQLGIENAQKSQSLNLSTPDETKAFLKNWGILGE